MKERYLVTHSKQEIQIRIPLKAFMKHECQFCEKKILSVLAENIFYLV